MSFSLINTQSAASAGSTQVASLTTTPGFAVGIGDLIVVAIGSANGVTGVINQTGLIDSAGNTYEWIATQFPDNTPNFGSALGIFYAVVTTALTAASTLKYTGTGNNELIISMAAYSGGATSSPLEITVTKGGGTSFSTLASGLPAVANELLVACNWITSNATNTYSGATGWSNIASATRTGSATGYGYVAMDAIVETTAVSENYLPAWTGAIEINASIVVSFTPYVAPPPPPTPPAAPSPGVCQTSRVIAYNAAMVGTMRTVNVTATQQADPRLPFKEVFQVAALDPNVGPTVMAAASSTKGLPTVYINGYTGPA